MSAPPRSRFILVVLMVSLSAGLAATAWHHPLSLANHGYWTRRIAVTVTNSGTTPITAPISLHSDALLGSTIDQLRVCTPAGLELLYDVVNADGASKRTGAVTRTDRIIVPIDCGATNAATVYLYAGNEHALGTRDYLPLAFRSRGSAQLPMLHVTVGDAETLALKSSTIQSPQFSREWPIAALIETANLADAPVGPVLVLADLRPTLGRWLKIQPTAAVRVVDAATGDTIDGAVRFQNNVIFPATLPARSRRQFHVYLAYGTERPDQAIVAYGRLLESTLNQAPNPSFEQGERGWTFGDDRARQRFAAMTTNDACFGAKSARFTVPTNTAATWTGWHSSDLPIRPGATYFYSGFLKLTGVDGTAALHAHWHNAAGAMATSGFAGTVPATTDAGWRQSSGVIQAPADAKTIQLHLTMNSHGTLQHDGILFCEVVHGDVLRLESADTVASSGSAVRVGTVNPLIKIFPADPPPPASREIAIECARNEFEPIQLVVTSARPMKGLQVTVSPLRSSRGDMLPPVKVERVGFVPIDYPTAYYSSTAEEWQRKVPRGAGSTDGWAGDWPDPLVPWGADGENLAPNSNQPVWLTVHTRSDTLPGDYLGEVSFIENGAAVATLPLRVRVLPFVLPDRTSLRAIFDFRTGPGGSLGKSAGERKKWLRFMAEHRLGVDSIDPQPTFTYTNGHVTMDAMAFDETARLCFDELRMNVSYTPRQFYMFGWAYPPKKLFGLEPFTPEWTAAFKEAYGLFTKHIRERGWHDRFVYYISDEPHFTHEFVVDQMKRLCTMIHEVDPTLPIYSSTWRHCAAWDQSLDLWGVGQFGCFPVPELQQVQRAGKGFWFTCDGQMATDTPYLATERMLPYYCFKYGATGFEFWGLSWWTYDPWQTGWHTFIRQSDDGKKYYWVRYPNGDGYLAYPGKPVGVDGPVSTIRLEQVREGLEDYEALLLLKQAVKNAKQAGRPAAAGEAALAMAADLVAIPNAGGLRSSEILPDPDRIPAIRKAVNAALVQLMR